MKRGLIIAALLVGFLCPAAAFWQSRDSNYNVAISGAAPSYTGPGDVFNTSPVAAYSCSEAYNAAGASTAVSACDLVDSAAPTVTICTLRFTSTGKVDLTAYCPGSVTPAAKCAAATGGVCNISKAYNLISPGTLDAVQTTAINQPTLAFSSTPLGTLPAINCGNGTPTILLQTSAGVTQAQPFTLAAVVNRTGTGPGGAIGGPLTPNLFLGSQTGANLADMDAGNDLTMTMTDNAWHTLIGLANGASNGAINVDGTDLTGNTGVNTFSSSAIRLCRATIQWGGLLAEAQFWGAITTSTNRNAISANAHSSGRYNF